MKLKKVFATVLAGGLLFCGGGTVTDAASDADMLAFREAYLTEKVDNRVFRQGIDFFGPAFHGEFEGSTLILRDASIRIGGNINWEYTEHLSEQTINETIPVYVEQNGDDMILYAQRNGRWNRFLLPTFPVGLANAIKTSDVNTLNKNMTAVKSVDVLQDTDDQRVMNVTIDGEKLAELLNEYSNPKLETLSAYEQTVQRDFAEHLSNALKQTDIVCSWAVDKSNWSTVSAMVDLTDVIRAYGQDVLKYAHDGSISLSTRDRQFYEALGYYSELHLDISYNKNGSLAVPQMPQGASGARYNDAVFSDWVSQINSSVK